MKPDVDLSQPEVDLDAETTVPAELAAAGYVWDKLAAPHPRGVWAVRKDGHRKLVPWDDFRVPTHWGLM